MQASKIFPGIILGLALTSNVYAANKTHITDMLGAGNSKTEISLGINEGRYKTNYLYLSSSTTADIDTKSSGYSLNLSYSLGITDRFDMAISAPLLTKTKSTAEYTSPPNTTAYATTEGQGDVSLQAQYLILDKQQDQVSWTVAGIISPSTAPSDDGSSEIVTNGIVTSPGQTAKAGRGYTQTGVATALDIPTSIGDVVLTASYYSGGEKNSAGNKTTVGNNKTFGVYLERMINEETTLTPYIGYSMNQDGSYNNQTTPGNSLYGLGFNVTHDLSKAFSVIAGAYYYRLKNYSYITSAGTIKVDGSGNSYSLFLSTLFFF